MILCSTPTITSQKGKVYTNIPFNGALATTLEIKEDLAFDNFDLSIYYALIINLTNRGKVIWYYDNAVDRDDDFARLLIEIPESGGDDPIPVPKIKIYTRNPNTLNSVTTTYTPHTSLTTPSLPSDDYNIWWSGAVNSTGFLANVGIRVVRNGSTFRERTAKSVGNGGGNNDVRGEVQQLNMAGVQTFALEFNAAGAIFGGGQASFSDGTILITN